MDASSWPKDSYEPALPETACAHPARYVGATPVPGTQLPLYSSRSPGLPLTAATINTVAGRMGATVERPAHSKGPVSLCLIAKLPSQTSARGRVY